jgi:hypothetical protein
MNKKNKIYKAAVAVAVALALILPVAAIANTEYENEPTDIRADPVLFVVPSAQIVGPSDIFTVSIWCDTKGNGINSLAVYDFFFNATLLQATTNYWWDGYFAPFNTLRSDTLMLLQFDNVGGSVKSITEGIFMEPPGSNVSHNASWFTIEFQAQTTLGVSDLKFGLAPAPEVGDPAGGTMPYDLINGSVTIEQTHYLTVYTSGTGTTDPTGSPSGVLHSYPYGTNVTLTAYPDPCWEFAGWSGDVNNMDNPSYIIMDGDYDVTATFTQKSYTLTMIAGVGGTTTPAPGPHVYLCGTTVPIEAFPDSCFEFAGWSGDVTGMTNPTSILIDGDKTVTASFTQPSYTLTIILDGSGSVNLNPPGGTYLCGTTVTMTAVPAFGWSFAFWSGDASGTANPETILMDGDKTVTATFKEEWLSEVMINGTLPGPSLVDIEMADWVYFGEKATALDGVDPEDLPYPGTPPAPYVAGWFMNEFVVPYDELERDIRYYPEVPPNEKIWDLWVETDTAGNGPTAEIWINWDPVILQGNEYHFVILRDFLSGDTLADMRVDDHYIFTADHGMGYHFEIVCGWNQCPIAEDDFYTGVQDVPLVVAAPGVLANDVDPEGDPMTAQNPSTPGHGTLTYFLADGSFEYVPDPGFSGTDTFTYEVTDGYGYCSDIGLVTIEICGSVSLDVHIGWNLISLPAHEFDYDKTNFIVEYMGTFYSWADALTNGYVLEFTYGWTGGMTGIYVNEDFLDAGEGYWLWAYEDCTLIMYSCEPEDNHIKTFDDGEGWYLVGAPYTYNLARWQTRIHYNALYYTWGSAVWNGIILEHLYDWDRPTQNYVLSDNPDFFESGVGYWMYAYKQCSLKQL